MSTKPLYLSEKDQKALQHAANGLELYLSSKEADFRYARETPENIPERQSILETASIVQIATNFSFTGILGVGLVLSALHPENNPIWGMIGAPLLLPVAASIRAWCKVRKIPEDPEPIGTVLSNAMSGIKKWNKLALATIGAAAIASTLLAAQVASPDYNYAKLKSSTSVTRLADPGVSNKFLSASAPLDFAATTIDDLEASNRSSAPERAKQLKAASVDYLKDVQSKKDSPEYKNLFTISTSNMIISKPYLAFVMTEDTKNAYIEQAFTSLREIPVTEKKPMVSSEAVERYRDAFFKFCRLAKDNLKAKEAVHTAELAMRGKVVGTGKYSAEFFTDIIRKKTVGASEACPNLGPN